MAEEFYPIINVIVSPKKVSRGQLISITANIFDKYTMVPMAFDTIFMEIIDNKGIPVWPLSLVEEESAGFSKLISTSELDAGKKYTIRVSPSRKLRPIGTAEFEIDARLIEPGFLVPGIALIPQVLLIAYPDSKRKEKSRSDVIGPDAPPFKIAWLIYRTEKDSRVCPLCRPHEGERYRPNDPDLPMIPIHPRCFTEGTDVMTNHGFKDFKDLIDNDLIFSLDPVTHVPEYVRYREKVEYWYAGKIHRYSNKWNCVEVTPNHDMYAGKRPSLKNRKLIKFKLIPSEQLNGEIIFYKSSQYQGRDPEFVQIGKHRFTPEQFAILMGYYLSEGSTQKRGPNRYQIKISQEKPNTIEIMKNSLDELPIKFRLQTGGFYFHDTDLGKYLIQFGKSWEKYIPSNLKEMSVSTIRTFLDCFLLGDGHISKERTYKDFRSQSITYDTSSIQMASDIVELLVKIGKSASMTSPNQSTNLQIFNNGTYLCTHLCYRIQELSSQYAVFNNKEEIDYEGFVRCVELEKNHILLIKKNNKITWQGNCRCHYDIISIEEEEEIYQAMKRYAAFQEIEEVSEVYEAYLTAKTHGRKKN